MTQITLSGDQQRAYDILLQFLVDPHDRAFVLEGYSGTGKTTLVSKALGDLPQLAQTLKLLSPNSRFDRELILSATTNKAAETMQGMLHQQVRTVHSVLGLRVRRDYRTGASKLVRVKDDPLTNTLLIIDEASYCDDELLKLVFKGIDKTCKVIFIGDPAQLKTVGSLETPVFNKGFTTARLTEVVRQAKGNPIIDLATQFRETVNTGQWFQFQPDGQAVRVLSRQDFEQEIIQDFTSPDWCHNASKVLAWTNRTVIAYNHAINNQISGQPEFREDDYAIVNNYIATKHVTFKTDETVRISNISEPTTELGIKGRYYRLNGHASFFMPDNHADRVHAQAQAHADSRPRDAMQIAETWVDLRAAFASTINKSQGSTYDRVYIDLDDLKACRDADQLARMLYVGTSRARHRVTFTGDLV